ncbi:hypothetical protein FSP39_005868 [Pinctada imbricata]|uniref:DNA-directed DNA polymerase n=1 Tax=Pinctada imbricata TaxID=66713 RepID=A0AA88YTK7_PINIB|nr:hypothetical protein FSP39_005868 [Pinctada imbricata]
MSRCEEIEEGQRESKRRREEERKRKEEKGKRKEERKRRRGQDGMGEEDHILSQDSESEHEDVLQFTENEQNALSNQEIIQNRKFIMTKVKEKFVAKFNGRETIYDISLAKDVIGMRWEDALVQIYFILEECIKKATEGLHPEDKIRIYIDQDHFETPIVIHLRSISSLTANDIMAEIEKVLQSKMDLRLNSSFQLQIATLKVPRGGGRSKLMKDAVDQKKSLICIRNKDSLCLARSILVAKAYFDVQNCDSSATVDDKMKLIKYREKIRKIKNFQTSEAEKLQSRVGLPMSHQCSFDDIKKFERELNVQIVVVNEEENYACQTYGFAFEKKIYVLYRKGDHFDAITKINAFLSKSYFCEKCLCEYNDKKLHKCLRTSCDICFSPTCAFETVIECGDCNRICKSLSCYEAHKKKGFNVKSKKETPSTCDSVYKCLQCNVVAKDCEIPRKEHSCDFTFCKNCKEQVPRDHECFQLSTKPHAVSSNYIFFDFECNQESGTHHVNYVVAQKTCDKCINRVLNNDNMFCPSCGEREKHFQNDEEFCKWAFSKEHRNYTLVAHNCKAYDGYFLLKYLLERKVKPEIIFRGGKILYMHVKVFNIRVIDSLNFIPSALSKLPSIFGLEELKKGYFPHLFNVNENQDYEGEIPEPNFYCVDQMNEKDRAAFLAWHKSKKENGYIFNFKEEMKDYCKSDVDILRRCCLEFRSLMINLTQSKTERSSKKSSPVAVDPFQYVTISSVCMAVYKFKFLKENTIGLLPFSGLTSRDRFSKISIVWLKWLMNLSVKANQPINIEHGENGRERRIGKYKVDGYCEMNKTAYEFLGCFYHGCKFCFPDANKVNPKTNTSFGMLRDKVSEKENYLKEKGLNYCCIWECDFRKQLESNEELCNFFSELDVQERLEPRDAFMGGRTNAIKLKHVCNENERIHYVDFCSLYPYVQKYCQFPVGYPTIITENFGDVTNYFGIIKCKVLPPRKLFHPVLGYKCNGTLRFPLCRTCSDSDFQGVCEHGTEDRSLTGTWTSIELQKAVSKGCEILKMYEVFHFDECAKYCPETNEDGLFTEYVNTFLKIKAEASGYPSWVKSEKDKSDYVKLFHDKEGIELDPNNIKFNPGLRALAKLMLNSFWGRFGMKGDYNQTSILFEASQLWQKLADDSIVPKDFHLFDDDCLVLEYCNKKEYTSPTKDANIFIAVFTTAHARLKLYEELERLGERVLYFDTDSIIYVTDVTKQEYVPVTGDFLGDLTNEVTCKETKCRNKNCTSEHFITQFVSAGPKNYAFLTDNGFHCCKIRGFTLNYENAKTLNFHVMDRMLGRYPEHRDQVYIRNKSKITRCKKRIKIFNREEHKKYEINYVKRVIRDDKTTVPYGY